MKYGSYHIAFDPPPIPLRQFDWHFWHNDFDGPGDGRCGRAQTTDEAKAEIDRIEDERHLDCGCTAPHPLECESIRCDLRDHHKGLVAAVAKPCAQTPGQTLGSVSNGGHG